MTKQFLSPLVLGCALAAQAYHIPSDTPGTGTCNVIPFGDAGSATWSNQVYQTIATATDLGNVAGVISGIAFAPCGTGVHRNTRLRITLSHVPPAHVLQPTFAANLPTPIVVLDQTNVVWNITAHQWNEVDLQVLFAYDGVSDLVMEVIAEGNTNTATAGMHRDVRPRAIAINWSGTPPATGSVDNAALKWRLTRCIATVGQFGEGCGGLSHAYNGLPQLGAAVLDATLAGCAPSSPAFLIIGTNNGAPFPIDLSFLGFLRCSLYQDLAVVIPTIADAFGAATVPLGPVPNLPYWSCVRLYTQGGNLNAGAPGGLTTSNYCRLLFGN